MAKFVSTNASLVVNGVDLSAYVKSVAVKLTTDEQDATGMSSAATKARLAGLRDGSIEYELLQDYAASTVDPTLHAVWLAGTAVTVTVKEVNTTTSATNPTYSGSFVLFDYTPVDAKVGQIRTTTGTFLANGTITRATS